MLSNTVDLIYNLALLVALSVVSGFIRQRRLAPGFQNALQGLLFGSAAVLGMMRPLILGPGLIFDGRSIMISVCGLFFGPVALGLAATMAAVYRGVLGGTGLIMGELVILSSALLGLAFHYRWLRTNTPLTAWRLLGLGLLASITMILLMFTLPAGVGLGVIQRLALPILLSYPLVTLLIGKILSGHADNLRNWEVLQASESQFRSYVEHSPIGVFICDERGRYLQVNPAAVSITGHSRETLLAMSVLELTAPESVAAATAHFQHLQDTGRTSGEFGFRHRNGHIGHWSVEAVRLGPTRFLGFASDLTERKRAEARQRQLQAQLQQAQKMDSLGSLAGGVAHDMNNVLAAILGLASAHMEIQPKESPAYHAFETIAKAATRGGKAVKGLLAFAHQGPAEETQLDMNAILREEVRLLERTTLAKVRLVMELDPELRPIYGDATALTHGFMNLCVNAVDAMTETGTLLLRTRNVDAEWIEVQVEDTGTGMASPVLERAMDPFFTTKEMGKGTGLGLSMVYSIVSAHHGKLEIQSVPGQGTCITMRFPVCPASPPQSDQGSGV